MVPFILCAGDDTPSSSYGGDADAHGGAGGQSDKVSLAVLPASGACCDCCPRVCARLRWGESIVPAMGTLKRL